MKASNFV